jgi:hypothetical protein
MGTINTKDDSNLLDTQDPRLGALDRRGTHHDVV